MATTRRIPEGSKLKKRAPATTPEEREAQIVAKAYDLAERQIDEGTASSQVITHFLKRGSTREAVEEERLEEEVKLMRIKAEAIESQKRVEILYQEAMDAFKSYKGGADPAEEVLDD